MSKMVTVDPGSLSPEQRREYTRLQKDSAYFCQKTLTVNGGPYSLEKFPYAKQIYEDESEIILFLAGRSITKSTIATFKNLHPLVTVGGESCLATAPTDNQAWRLTKEIFRPAVVDSQGNMLSLLIKASDGSDQVGEIDLANGSKWTAKGAWATGKAIRGPHRNRGIADEMQDMTRTAWYVFREVVNLPPRKIFAMGTGGPTGTIWHELWMKSDQKEWNEEAWIPQNKNATPGYSGYHITQYYSPFETPESLEDKRKNYPKTLFITEVLAEFYNATSMKPAPYEKVKNLIVTDIEEARRLLNSITSKAIGIDWGDSTRWVVGGMTADGHLVIIRTGIWEDTEEPSRSRGGTPVDIELERNERRTKEHLTRAKNLIEFEKPDYVMLDAGYSKKKNQMLMSLFPKRVWAVTTGDRKESFPSWVVRNRDTDTKEQLPKAQWEYFCDVDHSAMCENLETHINNGTFHILDLDQGTSMESYMLELNKADIAVKETPETVKRSYVITKAHSYAATSYLLLPFVKQRKKREKMFPVGY
jgi:hypothetical protein